MTLHYGPFRCRECGHVYQIPDRNGIMHTPSGNGEELPPGWRKDWDGFMCTECRRKEIRRGGRDPRTAQPE